MLGSSAVAIDMLDSEQMSESRSAPVPSIVDSPPAVSTSDCATLVLPDALAPARPEVFGLQVGHVLVGLNGVASGCASWPPDSSRI